eukprot:5084723-Prymnesium_polylepis.2
MDPAQSVARLRRSVDECLSVEASYRPCLSGLHAMLARPEILADRREAAESIFSAGEEFSLDSQTTWTAISFFDRYLGATGSRVPEGQGQLENFWGACLFLAFKMGEGGRSVNLSCFAEEGIAGKKSVVSVPVFLDEALILMRAGVKTQSEVLALLCVHDGVSTKGLRQAELKILKALEWRVAGPSPFHFIDHLSRYLREVGMSVSGDFLYCVKMYVLTSSMGARPLNSERRTSARRASA